jgi:hypothetical protein
MDSLKERLGNWGQKGMSKVLRTSSQASGAERWGRLPMPVVEKGFRVVTMSYYSI